MGDNTGSVVKLLKAKRPAFVLATLADGAEKSVKITQRRRKWDQAAEALDGMDWLRIELQDAEHNTICFEDRDAEPETGAAPPGSTESRDGELLRLLTEGQKAVLSHQDKMLQSVLNGNRDLVTLLADRLTLLERNYAAILQMAADAAATPAPQDAADGNGGLAETVAVKLLGEFAERSGLIPQLPAKAGADAGVKAKG